MCKGFKQISNDFFESDYWRQSRTYNDCEAVLDIIYQVRFEASEHSARIGGREVTWGQAQWPASVRFLAARWHWTEKKVRVFLSQLRRKGIIETSDSQGVNLITLKKYLVLAEEESKGTAKGTENELIINELQALRAQLGAQPIPKGHSKGTKHDNGEIDLFPPLSPKGETVYDWSLLSDDMRVIAEEWLQYKREKKQTYKPSGFKTFCKRLIQLSGNDPSKARLIIEHSMANNYSGIFELKDRINETASANISNNQKGHVADGDVHEQSIRIISRLSAEGSDSD